MSVLSLAEVGNRWHSSLGNCDEKWYNEEYVEKQEAENKELKMVADSATKNNQWTMEANHRQVERIKVLEAENNRLRDGTQNTLAWLETCKKEWKKSKKQIEAVQKILDEVPVFAFTKFGRRIREELQK